MPVFYSFLINVSNMETPLRVLIDTNIYGHIAKEQDPEGIVDSIFKSNLMVCGSKVIRRELKNISIKDKKSKKLRNDVLRFYSALVKDKRDYQVNKLINELAKDYQKAYKGKFKIEELLDDFLIVATASLHVVKIVCSNDERTMKEPEAILAYKQVNQKYELPEPEFITFEQLKQIIK